MGCDMLAAITGSADVEYRAVEALLDWYLPEDCLVLLDDSLQDSTVSEWLIYAGQEYVHESRDHLIDGMLNVRDDYDDMSLIVLGVEGNEDLIQRAWANDIEVADLTRAMYIVQQGIDLADALHEPQIRAHEVTDGLGGRGSLDALAPGESSQNPEIIRVEVHEKENWTREELGEMMAGIIQVHERQYHSGANPDTRVPSTVITGGTQEAGLGKVRCLRNKGTGVIRISPRARPKSSEEEIFLGKEDPAVLELMRINN